MNPDDIKKQFSGLVPYIETLEVLQAENKVFIRGQLILVEDALGRTGLKRGDWDILNHQPEDAATPFNDLPWILKPEAAGSGGINVFKVRTTNITGFPKYEIIAGDCVITDPRLIGVAEPFIGCTATGADLRDENITIDPAAGTITVGDFPGMDVKDHFSIVIPSTIKTEDSVSTILPRLVAVERALAPMATGNSVTVFKGTESEIDEMPGFHILTETEGRALFGYNEADPRFNTIWDTTGNKGHYEEMLTVEHIPDHYHQTVVDEFLSGNDHPSTIGRQLSSKRSFIRFWFKTDAIGKEAYELMGAEHDIDAAIDPDIPNNGPTSPWGTKEADRKAVDVLNPYITVWFLGYTPA